MKRKLSTHELVFVALLAAILCVSSYINIPLPFSSIPITAQLLVVFLIALLLRPRCATLTVLVWLLLGVVGLPVFSGGKGGFGVLAGPTGGFAIGYLLCAFFVAMVCQQKKKEYQKLLVIIGIGLPVTYFLGVAWMMLVTGVSWQTAVVTGVLPFVPGDIVKAVSAVFIARPLYAVTKQREP